MKRETMERLINALEIFAEEIALEMIICEEKLDEAEVDANETSLAVARMENATGICEYDDEEVDLIYGRHADACETFDKIMALWKYDLPGLEEKTIDILRDVEDFRYRVQMGLY